MSFATNVWEFDEEPSFHHPALLLPSKIVKQISECLDSQADRRNLCLVHKCWSPIAIEVLWSEPVFKTPDSFHLFIRTVQQSKRCALRVRILNLCAPEEQEKHAFVPVLLSQREEHVVMQPMLLSKPSFIMNIIRLCENLESLKVYGWNLGDKNIHSLPQYCPSIKKIHIIGNTQITQQALYSLTNSVAINLDILDLDGDFSLSDNFAETLATKCPNIKTLKFSTKTMSSNGFDILAAKLCNLRKLVLQDCSNLTDNNLSYFVERNPNLIEISVHGNLLTIESFKMVMYSLQNLQRLDLRCAPQSLNIPHDTHWFVPISQTLLVLLLDCLPIDDDLIHVVSNACIQLEKFGLSRCPYVTNMSVKYVAENARNLHFVNLLKCPKITEVCLKDLGCSANNTLTDLIVDSCGEFSREAIHWFAGVSTRLEKLEIHGLQSIVDSDIYIFSKEHNYNSQDSTNLLRCTFEGENIKKLANYDVSSSVEIPRNNTQQLHKEQLLDLLTPEYIKSADSILTNESIINDLACELGLNVDTLNKAIKKVLAKSNLLLPPETSAAASVVKVSRASRTDSSRSHKEKNHVTTSSKALKSNADISETKIKKNHTEKVIDKKPPLTEVQQKERTLPTSPKQEASSKKKEWSNVIQKTQSGWSSIHVKLPSLHCISLKETESPEVTSPPVVHEALPISVNKVELAIPSSVDMEKNEPLIPLNDVIKKDESVVSSDVVVKEKDEPMISSDGKDVFPTGAAISSNTQSEKAEVTQPQVSIKPQAQSISNQLQNRSKRPETIEKKPPNSPAWNNPINFEDELGGWEEMGITSMPAPQSSKKI
ncbi:3032_t:CDS:2 [Ambispora gerdemannii]|uniref:3032_t:CDS:1 n=1 Tax=Ambispora gerdemannii TaxID=144530 RepID=A0A9N9BU03_9GLOM|nr:3032_t:CDS:2 [Ambispora gerdemannii]